MSREYKLGHGAFAAFMGVARLFCLLILVAVLTPPQIYCLLTKRKNPFALTRFFHKCLLRILGIKLNVYGSSVGEGPVVFISNHSSYLDIPVLGSLVDGSFVAKAEVSSWPVIGFLSKLQQSVFVERKALRAAEQKSALNERLAQGHNIILFPEGTSSDGQRLLPFKSSLFSIAERNGGDPAINVQPISMLCTKLKGLPMGRALRPYYAWFGGMTFLPHLWNVFKIGDFTVGVIFHEPVSSKDFSSRKDLALYCHRKIGAGIEHFLTGRLPAHGQAALLERNNKELAIPD